MYELTKAKYLLDPELERLSAILAKFQESNPRDTALIYLALNTGARAQELLNITGQDLDPHSHTVFIKGLKNSFNRDIPIPKWLFDSIQKPPDPTAKVFPITYNRFHQIWNLYRPVPKKLHSLRHTFALLLYRKTLDLKLVQLALGHRQLANTMIYTNFHYTQTQFRKGILGAIPK